MRALVRRGLGLVAGAALAGLPALVSAQEGRALETGDDAVKVILVTVGAIAALFLVAALGWLYQQRRGLHWRFQDPDAPADHH
jgi:hypothetical protein